MLIFPKMLARAHQGQEGIFRSSARERRAPIPIPSQQAAIVLREVYGIRRDFGAFTRWVIGISLAEEAAPSRPSLQQHSIPGRVGRPIGNAVLNDMDVQPRANRPVYRLFPGSFDDLLHSEIGFLSLLAMQEGGDDPDFVGYLDVRFRSEDHK